MALLAPSHGAPALARPWGTSAALRSQASPVTSRTLGTWPRTLLAAAVVSAPKVRRKGPKEKLLLNQKEWPDEQSLLAFLDSEEAKQDEPRLARAVRHCGHEGWWEALLKAHQLQADNCFQLSEVASALADGLGRAPKAQRKEEALDVVGGMWRQLDLDNVPEKSIQVALGASFNLCLTINTERALSWAEQLWEWSEEELVEKNKVLWSIYLQTQEIQGRFDTVNDVLMRVFVEKKIQANARMLSALLELAAQRGDWKRADDLWHIMVDSLEVKPNVFVRAALAKVHFLAGRAIRAEEILRSDANGKAALSYRLSSDYLQILLIVCHSAPTKSNLKKIDDFVERNQDVPRKASASEEWRSMCALRQRLSPAEAPRLRDLLVTFNARKSVMKQWEDQEMGAQYV